MGNESFVRWQEVTRVQLSYLINLVLTFSVASIGFALSRLWNQAVCVAGYAIPLMIVAVFIDLISIFFGGWVSLNRLADFRKTAQVARNRKNGSYDLDVLADETDLLGERTWCLFRAQVFCFGIASVILVVAVLLRAILL